MNLRQLEHFVAVAEEQSFTRAAERLHMAQSPLSASVKRLEARLGVKLLRRTTRRVELTEAGAVLLGDASEMLAAAQASADRVRRAANSAADRLTVAHTATVSYVFLDRLRTAVAGALPALTLVTAEMTSKELVASVRRGQTDLGLCCCPEGTAGLERITVAHEPLALLVAEAHPLVGGPPVTLRAVAGARFQIFPREHAPAFHDRLVEVLSTGGAAPRLVVEQIASRGRERIASGELIALAPRALGVVRVSGTTIIELEPPAPVLAFEAVFRAGAPASVRHLVDIAAGLRNELGRRPGAAVA